MILSLLVTKKELICYLVTSIIVAIFGQIYEYFSYNVYSNYMIYSFVPFMLGFIFKLILYLFKIKTSDLSRTFITLSIETITLWMILKGVLEIYGTTNVLTNIYPILAIITFVGGLLLIKKNC